MSALARLQRDFLAGLFAEGPPAHAGIAAYRRNVLANLRGALASAYPVTRRLVGDAFFGEAAGRYARAHPSTSGDLHLYGARFAEFLADYPFARALPYLADVARLEWACHESFHAGDGAPLDVAALAAVPAQRHGAIRLRLHPSVRLVASPHPIASLWEANQPGRDGTPDASEGAERVMVSRQNFIVRVERLAPESWTFVEAIARGASIEEAFDASAAEASGDFLAPLLARLAARGAIRGFTDPEALA